MGLCKCSKKKVTNLFCFVHKVNVCEDCMIHDHSRCIVRSYLQWLQDSDYEPVCILCNQTLNNGSIVRLCCLDLFHIDCLDKYVQTSSTTSNLVSLKCPSCKDSFFPPGNMVSPVSNQMRETIKSFWWGQQGLGLTPEDYYDEEEVEIMADSSTNNIYRVMESEPHMTSTPLISKPINNNKPIESHDNHVTLELCGDQSVARTIGHPSTYNGTDGNRHITPLDYPSRYSIPQDQYAPVSNDNDDDKYAKKNPLQTVQRWYRNHTAWSVPTNDSSSVKRNALIALLLFFFFVTLIILTTRVGQKSADRNTHHDWNKVPHINTGQ